MRENESLVHIFDDKIICDGRDESHGGPLECRHRPERNSAGTSRVLERTDTRVLASKRGPVAENSV